MAQDILIVDDEEDIREILSDILIDEGFEARTAANSHDVFNAVDKRCPSLVILDVFLKNSLWDGMKVLDKLKQDFPSLPIIMMSGHGSIDMAVQAVKNGAYDFISKPFQSDELLQVIFRALDNSRLVRENQEMNKKLGTNSAGLIGKSAAIQQLKKQLLQLANNEVRVLLIGDIGTGKNTAAQFIHYHSIRRNAPYITVDCTNLNEDNMQMKLFGTPAQSRQTRQIGLCEQAHGGSLLFDNITALSEKSQALLARLLQTNRFKRLESDDNIDVNIRFFASAIEDVGLLVMNNQFNKELFYRIGVESVYLPTLNKRSEDIADLINHFSARTAAMRGKNARIWQKDVLEKLSLQQWHGNLWQLSNLVEKLHLVDNTLYDVAITIEEAMNSFHHEDKTPHNKQTEYDLPLREARELFERNYLSFHLDRFNGNITKTAEFVKLDRASLHRKLKSLDLTA